MREDTSTSVNPWHTNPFNDLPEDWERRKFSYDVEIAGGQVDPTEEPYSSMLLVAPNHVESETGQLLEQKTAEDQGAKSGKYLCNRGEVIYSKIRPELAKVAIAPEDCLCSADMYPIDGTPRFRNQYLYWVLLSRRFTENITLESQRVAMPKVNRETLSRVQLPAPPLDQQDKIVGFLSNQTSKIDEIIDKRERLQNLLKEKQQAYLTRLVTKGVGSDGEFDESSVPALDRLPSHWEEVKIRWLIQSVRNGWSPNAASRPAKEDEYGVLKLSAVSKGTFKPSVNKALEGSTSIEDSYLIEKGDVLVTRANTPELVADACTVDLDVNDLIAPDLIFIVKVNQDKLHPQYLSEWLVTPPTRAQVRADAHGSSGSMVKVSQQDFKDWQMPLPPLAEQECILSKINQMRRSIKELQELISQSISLLEEKRQALITQAVTGQIDITENRSQELETIT